MSLNSYQHTVRVYYEDTDAGGIVYYANYLKFFERARTEWLRELGINQSIFLEQNIGFVVTKVEMDNKASAKLDDLLTITTTISRLKSASLVFSQQLVNQQQELLQRQQERTLEIAETTAKLAANKQTIKQKKQAIAQAQEMLNNTSDQLGSVLNKLVPPTKITELLRSLLLKTHGLKLLELSNEAVEDITLSDDDENTAKKQADNVGKTLLYKHSTTLKLTGSYQQLYQYLSSLEQSKWELYWDQLHYKVIEYPQAEIIIRVHTISTNEHWIGL